MSEWLHLKDVTRFDTRSLAEICSLLREHVALCSECQKELATIDRHQAAMWMYGDVPDKSTRDTGIALMRTALPGDEHYIELVAEPLVSYYLRQKFPRKIWRTS